MKISTMAVLVVFSAAYAWFMHFVSVTMSPMFANVSTPKAASLSVLYFVIVGAGLLLNLTIIRWATRKHLI